MKILLVHPGASWSTSDVDDGLGYGLEQHGVEVIRYRLDHRITRSASWLNSAWKHAKKHEPDCEKPSVADVMYHAGTGALEMALRHQVDVVLVVSGMFLHPDVVVMMKRAGLMVTVLFTESPYDTDKELRMARIVDGCWTHERSVVPAFALVTKAGYLPHGWHPLRHQPGAQDGDADAPSHDVVFVGSAFPERVTWFDSVDWTGIDLGLYGCFDAIGSRHRLRRYVRGGTVSNAMAASLYRRAKINLNLYRASPGWRSESLNPRAYELAALGAFHLSEARAEVAEMFGDAVPTFATATEASALIRSWLADDVGRRRLAAQLPGCVHHASWTDRAATILEDVQTLRTKAA